MASPQQDQPEQEVPQRKMFFLEVPPEFDYWDTLTPAEQDQLLGQMATEAQRRLGIVPSQ